MAKKSKLQKMQSIQAKCQHDKTEIRKMNSLRFNLCLNCGHKELIEDLIPEKPKSVLLVSTKQNEKKPKSGSMLDIVLHSFPSEGEYNYEELLKLFRTTNDDMSKRADSSIKTVIKELVIGSKASPHINRYACLTFDESSKKFRRI